MCKDVSNVVSSSEGSGGRHPGESVPLELPGSGELGVGESDSEGGSVEGDVGDEDGRVDGRAGLLACGLWVVEERLSPTPLFDFTHAALRPVTREGPGCTEIRNAGHPGPTLSLPPRQECMSRGVL